MTTNQTIDGVPRELRDLLERVATEASHMLGFTYAANYDECRAAVDELRALLDAPAKDPCAKAIEHLERFKEVARSGDVGGVIEMGAELIGMAYFDNQEAAENVESTNAAMHGRDGLCNSDSACIPKHDLAAQPQGASSEVIAFGIQVEKLLCDALGREWSAIGISIESLVAELKGKPHGEPVARLSWEQIVSMVNEVLGCEAHKWPVTDVSHAMTGINFNSLARIIDRVQAEQPAPVAVNSLAMAELRHILDSNKGADGTLVISKKLAAQILGTK